MSDQEGAPRPGRRRSEESRMAILKATLELVAELGYAGLTIEGIAARSGVGKQTIYRWWPSKADVLFDALAAKADLHIPVPDTGSGAEDLRAFLTAKFALVRSAPVAEALRALMGQAQIDPDFGARFRDGFLNRRGDALRAILDRGDLTGKVRPDTIADILLGVIWYRLLATNRRLDKRLADELVALLAPEADDTGRTT